MAFAFWQTMRSRVLGNIVGFGAGAAAAQAFEPPLRDLAAELEAVFTSKRLTPEALAELVIRGVRPEGAAAGEAAESGINSRRFHELTLLAGNPPGPGELLDLLNRGAITGDDFERGVRQGRMRSEWIPALLALRDRLLSPELMASAAVRGLVGPGDAAAEAARQGVNGDRFELLRDVQARPPALGELLDLLNRGATNESAVRAAIRDAGIRAEWVDPLIGLRVALPPLSDLIRFAVREVYAPDARRRFELDQDFPEDFAREAARHGMVGDDARNYWAAHWDLPSPEQGFRMFHRRLIGRPDLELLMRALDVMPFWRPKLIELAYLVPGRIDLRRMYRFGVIDEKRLVDGYLDLGYSPADAELLARFAAAEKTEPERDLTKAEVVSLYESRTIDRAQAESVLGSMGYAADELGLILSLADSRRDRAYRNAVLGVVRRRFTEGEIDAAAATGRLDTIGVPPDERERLLDLWTFERAENPRHISEAQMRTAWRRGIVAQDRYVAHLGVLNYPAEEIEVLVALYAP